MYFSILEEKKKMKKSIGILCWVLISTLLSISCKNQNKPTHTNSKSFDYSDYIYNHTSGIKSTKASVKISLAKITDVDKEKLSTSLSIHPKIDGYFDILNNKQIVFTPKHAFSSDTEYQITLRLTNIYPKEAPLSDYTFSFKTKKQDFDIKTQALQSYNKDWQYITGKIKTNDITSLDKVKKVLKATQNNKQLSVKFEEINIDTDVFLFKIDSIYRELEDSKILIQYNGNALGVDKNETREINIHGKNNFKVVDVKVVNDAEQYLEINFTDPLSTSQNLKGLISIQGIQNLKYIVSGNIVKIYPKNSLKGEYNIEIYKGIQNIYGYKFNNDMIKTLSFDEPKPQVKFTKSGHILPNSGNLNIQFEAINLKAVEVSIYKIYESNILQFLQQNNLDGNQNIKMVARPIIKKVIPLNPSRTSDYLKWQPYGIALDQLINVDKGAIYRVKISYKKAYSTYECKGTSNDSVIEEKEENFDEANEESQWDNDGYYSEYESYNWRNRDNPCTDSYYANKSIYKNIIATDIGLTVKKGNNGSFFIATNNTVTSEPLTDVDITFYNFQQQPIANTKTNDIGVAIIDIRQTPFFVTAKKDGQTTYIKVNDGNVLSLSNFNTDGVKPLKGIKGYIYTERGVWRPGDTIYTAFMLNDLKNKIPKNHPVTIELKDPNGVLKYRKVTTNHLHKLYTFKIPTKSSDVTGRSNITIAVGGATFNKSIKIETIKPNRLKINVETEKDILTQKNNISINSKWLHGAIAKNLKVESTLMLKSLTTTFKQFPNYVFSDPSKKFETEESNVLTSKLDEKGNVDFLLSPKINSNAPGMLTAYLTTKVFENGGDFSTDVYQKPYSPFTVYTGLKRPVGDKARNMLLTDKQHLFELVSVTETGKPVANQNLEVKVYKMRNSWWWNNTNNYSQFNSSTFNTSVYEKSLTTNSKGKATFNFEIKYPEWGRYFVQVTNKKSGHSTGESVFIDWPGWAGKAKKGNQKEAAMLVFTTDKEKYSLHEEVIVNFPSSENGNALITIENNEKVLKYYRVTTQKENTLFKFKVNEQMTPNVYINITSLQAHNNTKNDLPIRMYGVKNIYVENSKSHLYPTLQIPKEVEPEKEFEIKVAEKNGQPLTYTIAIVDEGLLDLTRFKTPNPWSTFNAKEALGVKTWDMYDDVIGAFGGKLNQVFSIGGDQNLGAAKTQKANRFKPVVLFKGPFSLEANNTNKHKITLPKYIGAVKAMVVAHNPEQEAYGQTDASVLVKKPLMLLASAPRKVSIHEKIKIPITVFNSLNNKQNIKVKISTNDVFNIEGTHQQEVTFNEPGDEIAFFDIKAVKSGIGKITITAKNGNHVASYDIELDSYNPISKVTKSNEFYVDANSSKKITMDGFGIENSNKAQIEISTFPQINFSDRLQYLIRYPHGCLEQTVSAVFPQLYMNDLFDTSTSDKNKITENIKAGIQKLNNFQLLSGGFTYWPGASKPNEWVTNYAGHFLIEAENQGYILPYNFKNNWIAYQKQIARTWRKTSNNTYLEQAYRLYSLALAKSPELSIMNRFREDKNIDNISKLRLALAYAIIGQKDAAQELMSKASLINYSRVYQINHGSTLINKSIALETYQALNNHQKAREMVQDIAKKLNTDHYLNTKTTAKCLLALANFYKNLESNEMSAILKINKNKIKVTTQKNMMAKNVDISKGNNAISIENKGNQTLYIKLTNSGIPEINNEESISKNLISNVKYLDNNGKALDVSKLSQGTSFVAEIEVKNTVNNHVKDVAMTYQIPSGWELLNTRYATGEVEQNSQADYIDFKDNTVHYYFDLKNNETKKFKVKINTTYLGNYYLPGNHVEAMYDNNYMSHTKGKWIQVIP